MVNTGIFVYDEQFLFILCILYLYMMYFNILYICFFKLSSSSCRTYQYICITLLIFYLLLRLLKCISSRIVYLFLNLFDCHMFYINRIGGFLRHILHKDLFSLTLSLKMKKSYIVNIFFNIYF